MDAYISKAIPQAQLEEAVSNKTAMKQLEQIKGIIAFDPSSLNSDVKRIVSEGRAKITKLESIDNKTKQQMNKLDLLQSIQNAQRDDLSPLKSIFENNSYQYFLYSKF